MPVFHHNEVYFNSFNILTDTTVIIPDKNCCISQNVGKTKRNLVTQNSLYFSIIKGITCSNSAKTKHLLAAPEINKSLLK